MRICLFLLLFVPMGLMAQDFTRSPLDVTENLEDPRLLIAPVHPHYLLSELDRKLTNPEDVKAMRERVRAALNRRITEAFSDSMDTYDMLFTDLGKVDRLEFFYNGLDVAYTFLEEDEEKENGGFKWTKRKKEYELQGAEVKVENGQLRRDEIVEDRYMAVRGMDPVMLEYLYSQTGFTYMLVITQVELRRNLRRTPELTAPYLYRIHYALVDKDAHTLAGGKLEGQMEEEDVNTQVLFNDIFVTSSAELVKRVDAVMHPSTAKPKPAQVGDQEDY